jgi:hypothetical protein
MDILTYKDGVVDLFVGYGHCIRIWQ